MRPKILPTRKDLSHSFLKEKKSNSFWFVESCYLMGVFVFFWDLGSNIWTSKNLSGSPSPSIFFLASIAIAKVFQTIRKLLSDDFFFQSRPENFTCLIIILVIMYGFLFTLLLAVLHCQLGKWYSFWIIFIESFYQFPRNWVKRRCLSLGIRSPKESACFSKSRDRMTSKEFGRILSK